MRLLLEWVGVAEGIWEAKCGPMLLEVTQYYLPRPEGLFTGINADYARYSWKVWDGRTPEVTVLGENHIASRSAKMKAEESAFDLLFRGMCDFGIDPRILDELRPAFYRRRQW